MPKILWLSVCPVKSDRRIGRVVGDGKRWEKYRHQVEKCGRQMGKVRGICGRRSAGIIFLLLSLRFKMALEFTYGLFSIEGRRFLEEKAKFGL